MIFPVPVIGFCAFSGTGKTTLLVKLIPLLQQKGVRLSVIKHAHHDFDIDSPGKDSYELRKAGTYQTLIASDRRQALITERRVQEEPRLSDLVNALDTAVIDLVLVEGFRHLSFPKIELHRPSTGKSLIHPGDASIIAVATDESITTGLPLLDINDTGGIADFIIDWLGQQTS